MEALLDRPDGHLGEKHAIRGSDPFGAQFESAVRDSSRIVGYSEVVSHLRRMTPARRLAFSKRYEGVKKSQK